MTMSFPCNECQTPTTQSHHPDRWLCPKCGAPANTSPRGEGEAPICQGCAWRLPDDSVGAHVINGAKCALCEVRQTCVIVKTAILPGPCAGRSCRYPVAPWVRDGSGENYCTRCAREVNKAVGSEVCRRPTQPDEGVEAPVPGGRSFAQEPKPEMSREDVVTALAQMAGDKRITNEPVQAIFRRAAQLIQEAGAEPRFSEDHYNHEEGYRYTLEEAQKKHRQSMMDSGIDPASPRGVENRASFYAGWMVARAR